MTAGLELVLGNDEKLIAVPAGQKAAEPADFGQTPERHRSLASISERRG